MCSLIFSIYLVSLFNVFLPINCNNQVSFKYTYDYLSSVEVKLGDKEYSTVLNYVGKVELSDAYTFSPNDEELTLVKLKVEKCDELKIGKSIIGIVIRSNGLVKRMVVDSEVENGLLNLLKGVVNLMSIDEARKNNTEIDVSGECEVNYRALNETFLIKEKHDCKKTKFYSSIPETLDSFSIYQNSKVKVQYIFNNKVDFIISVNSLETHLVESVLSDQLSQTFRSTTSLSFNEVSQSIFSKSKSNVNVEKLIENKFGKKYKDIFLLSSSEMSLNKSIKNKIWLMKKFQKILSSYNRENRAQTTLELMMLFRRVDNISIFKEITKENKNIIEVLHDAFIGCGTKICSEIVIIEFDKCLRENISETNRMLLLIQHINLVSEFMVEALWNRLIKNVLPHVYDQVIQTISSLFQKLQNTDQMTHKIKKFIIYINNKLNACFDDQCLLVHLTAIRNTRMPIFYNNLMSILFNSGNYTQTVIANVYNTLSSLSYDEIHKSDVRQTLFKVIKREINFYRDPRLKFEAIFCLIRLESETKNIVSVLNLLQGNDQHLFVFLIKKLRELINMGVISDGEIMLESKFFQQQNHHYITYKDTSNMLINKLMTTPSLYSDIHFNIIGENGGVIRNSMTDIFLVTTTYENHLFSLATHITGLQSATGVSENIDEGIEGSLQLVLFGKEARPIQLFEGTTQLMSALWNAPNTPESLLKLTLFPIEINREITFQNGIVLIVKYMGSTHINFLFQLHSSIWYKTAKSLLNVDGQVYIKMKSYVTSLSTNSKSSQSLSLKSGLDFETNIDFSDKPIKNCLSVSRPKSQMHSLTVSKKFKKLIHFNSFSEIEGSCYSLSKITDLICAKF